jgi:hypothetical protein
MSILAYKFQIFPHYTRTFASLGNLFCLLVYLGLLVYLEPESKYFEDQDQLRSSLHLLKSFDQHTFSPFEFINFSTNKHSFNYRFFLPATRLFQPTRLSGTPMCLLIYLIHTLVKVLNNLT